MRMTLSLSSTTRSQIAAASPERTSSIMSAKVTPVHSPESNGIAEAFVKTFKCDYARIHPLPDAATVLRQIARWFDDYNESHPHSGLGMISPREFIRAQAT